MLQRNQWSESIDFFAVSNQSYTNSNIKAILYQSEQKAWPIFQKDVQKEERTNE